MGDRPITVKAFLAEYPTVTSDTLVTMIKIIDPCLDPFVLNVPVPPDYLYTGTEP